MNVPVKWLLLSPGEDIIAAIGQKYELSSLEQMASVLTLGIAYFIYYRYKIWERSAIFLTNKRLIEMTIQQHKGRIPVAFTG